MKRLSTHVPVVGELCHFFFLMNMKLPRKDLLTSWREALRGVTSVERGTHLRRAGVWVSGEGPAHRRDTARPGQVSGLTALGRRPSAGGGTAAKLPSSSVQVTAVKPPCHITLSHTSHMAVTQAVTLLHGQQVLGLSQRSPGACWDALSCIVPAVGPGSHCLPHMPCSLAGPRPQPETPSFCSRL